MKTINRPTKILAAIALLVFSFGSAYSQQLISSVSVSETANFIKEMVSTESSSDEINLTKGSNWMSNISYLDASSSLNLYKLQIELNKPVVEYYKNIENWMLDDEFWIIEETMDIEDWMLDDRFWNIISDEESLIEPWMLDDDFWILVN